MAQIIDFASRKKMKELGTALAYQEKEESLPLDFNSLVDRNLKMKEKLRKERDLANKNVMKTYKIKQN